MSEDKSISSEEFAQYDRQIRLWGLDAQKRLRKAKVLVIGLGGLGSEVVKNVVLAGVDSMTLIDDRVVSEEDLHSQLLITPQALGKNIAEASLKRTQELNPNVSVVADTRPFTAVDDVFIQKFDVVCMTRCSKKGKIRLNHLCRSNNVKFICGDVFGFYGYCFIDLLEHVYVEEVPVKSKATNEGVGDEPAAKRSKVTENETVSVKKSLRYCAYEEALKEDWTKRNRRSLKHSSQVFFIMRAIDAFQEKYQKLPERDESDLGKLKQLCEEILSSAGVPVSFVNETFPEFSCSVLNPVCAIVGGVMAQEIIKAISKKDRPHQNFFFFDGTTHAGIVDNICPAQS